MGDKINPVHIIVENLKSIVDRSLDEDHPEKHFLDCYTKLREKIKDIKGTGSVLTGITEFFYLSYLKNSTL